MHIILIGRHVTVLAFHKQGSMISDLYESRHGTPRGRKFALLTILFLRAGALIPEAVEGNEKEGNAS